MARIRTIKPEFWKHEALSALPEATHMLAAALLNYADDEGYFNANIKLVQAECCPLREPSVSIHGSLTRLSKVGYIQLGTGEDGRRYGRVVNFDEHQRVNRPSPSKIKILPIQWDDSVNIHGALTEPSPPEQGTGNREQGTISDAAHPHPASAGRRRRTYPESFDRFWSTFPKRGTDTKAIALKAWGKARRAGTDEATLQAGAERYAAYVGSTGCEAAHVQTWINREGWTASYSKPNGTNGHERRGNERASVVEAVRWLDERRESDRPRAGDDAPPGEVRKLERR